MDSRWHDGLEPGGPSLNHPEFKSTWGRSSPAFRAIVEWVVVSNLVGVPSILFGYTMDSPAWGVGVAFAGIGLYYLTKHLNRRRERSASSRQHEHDSLSSTSPTMTSQSIYSLQDERDRLAAENARLKARLRRVEHGE